MGRTLTLTKQRLAEVLNYDPETGEFRWRVTDRMRKAGAVAGNVNNRGYVKIMVDGTLYAAHRLAWFWAHGEWPDGEIDHMNRCPGDNRIGNLRVVTAAANRQNQGGAHKNNRLGARGVTLNPRTGKYIVQITVNGKTHSLGSHETLEGAKSAYECGRKTYHPHKVEVT